MIIVAQPRHAFACARGRGKTGVTVTVTGLSLSCFSSISIFNTTLREEPSLHRSEFPIHVHGPVFMALCRLSRVPWSEVEAIKQPKLNLVTVGRDSSFPSPPGAGKGMPWLSHSLTTVSISKIRLQKGKFGLQLRSKELDSGGRAP